MSAKLMKLLRGRVSFSLVDGVTELNEPTLYPFGSGRLPLVCESPGDEPSPLEAFESGVRSIAYEQ
jgi:hypothetical protein